MPMPVDNESSKRPDFDAIVCAIALEKHAFSIDELISDAQRNGCNRRDLPRELERDCVALLRAAQDWFDDERVDRQIRHLPARTEILAAADEDLSVSFYEFVHVLRETAAWLRQFHTLNELRPNRRKR